MYQECMRLPYQVSPDPVQYIAAQQHVPRMQFDRPNLLWT